MCGIGGLSVSPSLTLNPASLWASLTTLAHRGPDDSGVYEDHDRGVGLTFVRLAILDLSPLGHQPMHSEDGAVVLVFNGEIYNFRELRADLEAKGISFLGHSDTEVLLKLYLTEGEAMLSRLNGIFAFALWDGRQQALLIARDAFGVKPLYYAALDGRFAFASEIKALLHLIPQSSELDVASLHRYLSFLWCPGEGTPLKTVHKLLPGEAMWVRAGSIERRWTWYQLPIFRGVSSDLDEKAALAGTASHLRQAVQRQMVADVPLGAFLSGGLDSSAIVAFACEFNPNIHCFTIESVGGQEDGDTDDLPYARKVARHLNVPLEVVKIDSSRMAGDLERMVWQLDEPLADPAPLNVLYISELARQQGIKVLLSGAGGDDLFTGYRRHRAVQLERYWSWLPKATRSGLERATAILNQRNPVARRLTKLLSGAGLSGDERLVNYFVWVKEAELMALYTPGFRAELAGVAASAPMLDFLRPLSTSVQPLERMLALEQRFFLADHNLTYTDKMSMAAGVEVRVPFLDLDLVDFVARIPVALKQRGQVGKWVLKKAMEPYLPHDVIYRPKSGFGAPLRRWMRHELREMLGDLLSVDSLKRRGLFEPFAVQRLIAANDAGKVDAAYTLLSLLCIEIWCRRFVDGGPAQTVRDTKPIQ
jgi:asparagine synthase (glutamine-hydrolysing)